MSLKVDIKQKKRGKDTIIKDINFELYPGQLTLIVGTSGAGKSTMLSCITGQTKYKGSVTGINKKSIAFVDQHPALNPDETVYEAIYYSGRYDSPRTNKAEIERKTYFLIDSLGLNHVRNKKICKLSGGQLKRAAIATELVRNDLGLLILDEPDSGLDPGVARILADHNHRITKDKRLISLVISHNVSNVDYYDRVLVLARDEKGIGGVAFFGDRNDALTFFGCKSYSDIFKKINSKEEEGMGLGGDYIRKFKEAKEYYL